MTSAFDGHFKVEDAKIQAIVVRPQTLRAAVVFVHGPTRGMRNPLFESLALLLAEREIGSFRFDLYHRPKRSKPPVSLDVVDKIIRAACLNAGQQFEDLPIVVVGEGFGAWITSQAQAITPIENVVGLVLLGLPLHEPKKPSKKRSDHLSLINCPVLCLSGDLDVCAEEAQLQKILWPLKPNVELVIFPGLGEGLFGNKAIASFEVRTLFDFLEFIDDWIFRKFVDPS